MRGIFIGSVVSAFTLAVVGLAAPAQAYALNASIQVAPVAYVNKKGDKVSWNVSITCPKKKRYSLGAQVLVFPFDYSPEYIPAYIGIRSGDSGVCTGKVQKLRLRLTDVFPSNSKLFPTTYTSSAVGLTGTGFWAFWCYGLNCTTGSDGLPRTVLAAK